ncbi:hypothetical protein BDB01DRAFT_803709, partial [Pilobolus umbonatus]
MEHIPSLAGLADYFERIDDIKALKGQIQENLIKAKKARSEYVKKQKEKMEKVQKVVLGLGKAKECGCIATSEDLLDILLQCFEDNTEEVTVVINSPNKKNNTNNKKKCTKVKFVKSLGERLCHIMVNELKDLESRNKEIDEKLTNALESSKVLLDRSFESEKNLLKIILIMHNLLGMPPPDKPFRLLEDSTLGGNTVDTKKTPGNKKQNPSPATPPDGADSSTDATVCPSPTDPSSSPTDTSSSLDTSPPVDHSDDAQVNKALPAQVDTPAHTQAVAQSLTRAQSHAIAVVNKKKGKKKPSKEKPSPEITHPLSTTKDQDPVVVRYIQTPLTDSPTQINSELAQPDKLLNPQASSSTVDPDNGISPPGTGPRSSDQLSREMPVPSPNVIVLPPHSDPARTQATFTSKVPLMGNPYVEARRYLERRVREREMMARRRAEKAEKSKPKRRLEKKSLRKKIKEKLIKIFWWI